MVANMIKLVSERNKTLTPETTADTQDVTEEVMDTESELEKDGDGTKAGVKRQHSTGGSTGDTDEEIPAGFTKVNGNRKSTRAAKKATTPLETIANVPAQENKSKRSSSK